MYLKCVLHNRRPYCTNRSLTHLCLLCLLTDLCYLGVQSICPVMESIFSLLLWMTVFPSNSTWLYLNSWWLCFPKDQKEGWTPWFVLVGIRDFSSIEEENNGNIEFLRMKQTLKAFHFMFLAWTFPFKIHSNMPGVHTEAWGWADKREGRDSEAVWACICKFKMHMIYGMETTNATREERSKRVQKGKKSCLI